MTHPVDIYTLSTHPIDIPSQHTLLIRPLDTHCRHALLILVLNLPYQPTLLTHLIIPPSQPTLSIPPRFPSSFSGWIFFSSSGHRDSHRRDPHWDALVYAYPGDQHIPSIPLSRRPISLIYPTNTSSRPPTHLTTRLINTSTHLLYQYSPSITHPAIDVDSSCARSGSYLSRSGQRSCLHERLPTVTRRYNTPTRTERTQLLYELVQSGHTL